MVNGFPTWRSQSKQRPNQGESAGVNRYIRLLLGAYGMFLLFETVEVCYDLEELDEQHFPAEIAIEDRQAKWQLTNSLET